MATIDVLAVHRPRTVHVNVSLLKMTSSRNDSDELPNVYEENIWQYSLVYQLSKLPQPTVASRSISIPLRVQLSAYSGQEIIATLMFLITE